MAKVKFYCVACKGSKYRDDKNVYYTSRRNPLKKNTTWFLVSDCGGCKHQLWRIVGPGSTWGGTAKQIALNKNWNGVKRKFKR